MESIIMPFIKFLHDIPDDLLIIIIGILVVLFYNYIFKPWNKNINNISNISEKLNSIENMNIIIKSEIKSNLKQIEFTLLDIKKELEDLILIKRELEKQVVSTNKIEMDFIKRFYEIENKLIKITTQLEPVLVSLKGIK